MRKIRTIIVDDEVLGRNRLKTLLQDNDLIQLVGEGKNGTEAIRLIEDYKPDLALLDIEMPDKTGTQVMSAIAEEDRPFFIFVTAHDRFALKAFDLKATDFVLKPYNEQRFNQAIDQAISQIELLDQSKLNAQLLSLVDDYRSATRQNPFVITVKIRGVEKRINLFDVIYIEAEGNYLKLQLENERFLIRQTMQQMVEELDPTCFLRIHRSIIINTNYLKMKSYKGNNEFVFKLRNGEEMISGRSHKAEIDEFFAVV